MDGVPAKSSDGPNGPCWGGSRKTSHPPQGSRESYSRVASGPKGIRARCRRPVEASVQQDSTHFGVRIIRGIAKVVPSTGSNTGKQAEPAEQEPR